MHAYAQAAWEAATMFGLVWCIFRINALERAMKDKS